MISFENVKGRALGRLNSFSMRNVPVEDGEDTYLSGTQIFRKRIALSIYEIYMYGV